MKKRLKLLIKLFCIAIVLFLLALGYSYFIEPRRLVVNQQSLAIKGWDPALEGFKIVAIGDIHGGSNAVDDAKLHRIVELTNAQNPDLVVLLGDYVSQVLRRLYGSRELKMPPQTVADGLAGIKAKYGVIVVTGNHDDWYGHDEVSNAFKSVGYTVLDDQIFTVEANGHNIRVLGLMDQLHVGNWGAYTNHLKQVIQSDGGTGPLIVLEHSPDILPIITGDLLISPDLRLILAAHTHGGQVWLPLIGTPVVPSSYGQKYSYGHIQENGVDMFVTSGIGTSILPFRFMMPPEIAVLTIQSGGQ
jgi:predicted MPP superfamily phosphohydrolase